MPDVCIKCGWWERICHCGELSLFNSPKDRLYEFTDYKNFKHPVEVHGKKHWKALLKANGLTDDVKGWKPTPPETIKKEWIAHEISTELQDKGLYHKLLKRRGRR